MHIVFDIGGTHLRIARSDDGLTLSKIISHETPVYFNDGIKLIITTIRELSEQGTIVTLSGACAGVIDKTTGTVVRSPNLTGWEGHSFKEHLQIFSKNIFIENDAACAGLAESLYGAGKGFSIVAFMTVSTGIGGARIINNQIDTRIQGFEPGQQIIDWEHGLTLESLASGKALKKMFNQEPRNIRDPAIWQKATEQLASGIHNTIVHWSPEIMVVGGPMILNEPGIKLEEVISVLNKKMNIFPALPIIRRAELGDSAGLYGALVSVVQ